MYSCIRICCAIFFACKTLIQSPQYAKARARYSSALLFSSVFRVVQKRQVAQAKCVAELISAKYSFLIWKQKPHKSVVPVLS